MNETEPPLHPASQAEADGLPALDPSDPVKSRSVIPGVMLFCANALLAVLLFVLLARPAERASGHGQRVPLATVTATAVATDSVGLPLGATPTIDAMATATPVRGVNPPAASPTSTIPLPTATSAVMAPTSTPTSPPPAPTFNPGG